MVTPPLDHGRQHRVERLVTAHLLSPAGLVDPGEIPFELAGSGGDLDLLEFARGIPRLPPLDRLHEIAEYLVLPLHLIADVQDMTNIQRSSIP
jgi:hypothetical protein